MYKKWKQKSHREVNSNDVSGDDTARDMRPSPRVRVNTHVRDELKNADQIKKMKREKDKMKLKNMEKDKRRQILGKRKQAMASSSSGGFPGRGGDGKRRSSGGSSGVLRGGKSKGKGSSLGGTKGKKKSFRK